MGTLKVHTGEAGMSAIQEAISMEFTTIELNELYKAKKITKAKKKGLMELVNAGGPDRELARIIMQQIRES